MFIKPKNILSKKEHGFTLIELIVVIIIVGILAAIGMTQYSRIVEKSRLAEAKVRLGVMRDLAHEYYLNNGTLTGITNADLGINYTCASTDFYRYCFGAATYDGTSIDLDAVRCTSGSGGKTPNATRRYYLRYWFYPGTGVGIWTCWYQDDGSPCFGLPAP